MKGTAIMAAGIGTAAKPAPVQALREAGENGSIEFYPARLF
jgi:hypothetical protein